MKHKHGLNPFRNDDLENNEETKETEEVKENKEDENVSENTEEIKDEENSESDKRYEVLKDNYDKLNSQYMRLAADFENFRKRQESEKENLLRFGLENALSKMIEVLDNFERAEKALENTEDYTKYKESFELLHKQVIDSLAKLGLEPINAQGQEFDPNLHEAVMQTPTSEHQGNTVIAELQKGYKLGEKVLRPSMVNVATEG
jgi:molecular chaperone GrpE